MGVLRHSVTFASAHYLLYFLTSRFEHDGCFQKFLDSIILVDRYYMPQTKILATCSLDSDLFHDLLCRLSEKVVCMLTDEYFAEEEIKDVCGE